MKFTIGQAVSHVDGTLGKIEALRRDEFQVQWEDGEYSSHPHGVSDINPLRLAPLGSLADPVDKPAHYQHPSGIEVIDITRHESFLRGNVLKYVLRAPYKNNELEDLKKAAKYLAWEIERVENDAEAR